MRVNLRGVNRAGAHPKSLSRFRMNNLTAIRETVRQRRDFAGFPVQHTKVANTVGDCMRENHFVAVFSELVLMKIKTLAFTRNSRKSDYAMTGIGVNP